MEASGTVVSEDEEDTDGSERLLKVNPWSTLNSSWDNSGSAIEIQLLTFGRNGIDLLL